MSKVIDSTGNKLEKHEEQSIRSLIPPDNSEEVGTAVFALLEEILRDRDRRRLPGKWLRNYEMYRNKHWRSHGRVPLVSANMVYNHIERTVNMLTDNNPTFDIHSTVPDISNALHKLAQYWWNETEQQDVLAESIKMSEIHGCVGEKVIFNPNLNNGLGEVEVITVDPHDIGFWPTNEKRYEKWEAVLHFYTMPVNQLRRKFPDVAAEIMPDELMKHKYGQERENIQGGSVSPVQSGNTLVGDEAVKRAAFYGNSAILNRVFGKGKETLVVECWVKDYSTTVQEEEREEEGYDEFGMPSVDVVVEKVRVPKYPGFIRCITTCNGGNVILSDRPNPSISPLLSPEEAAQTYLFDRFPFTFTPSVKDPVSPFGFAQTEQLEQLNMEVNKCLSQLNLAKDRQVRTPLVNPRNSGIKNRQFTNSFGQIVRPRDHVVAQGLRFLDPPQIQGDIMAMMNIYQEFFNLLSGQMDLTDPNTMKGRMAHKTVAAILENMNTIVRGKTRNYGKMIRERGRMYLSHVMNWYTEERTFYYSDAGQTQAGSIVGREALMPVHFEIVSGSTMPQSKLQIREEALQLYQSGAIDVRAFLERIEYPGRHEVIRRMEAGPNGELIRKLTELNALPPEAIEVIQRVSQMDDSEYNAYIQQAKEQQADQLKQAEGM